jgi:hypothetical protein
MERRAPCAVEERCAAVTGPQCRRLLSRHRVGAGKGGWDWERRLAVGHSALALCDCVACR